MGKRTFDVDAEPVLPEGFWPDGPPMDFPDRPALEAFMIDMAAVLDRIGGTLSVIALRREIAPEMFVPIGFRAQWSSYAPAQRLPQQPQDEYVPPADPEPEPEPESITDYTDDEDLAQAAADAEEETDDEADPFDDDFGPDAEEALREQAVAAATE